jgi:AraC family transcriptional regulator of adaptative response/methylated-DNA-[protein]-cysteine methyltransferase
MSEEIYIDSMADRRWDALLSKDKIFDGLFFFAVKTTGIYCRPSCSSKRAKRENVVFFATAAEAEREGFRPCLRCRPNEKSPADGDALLIARALEHISRSNVETVADLAEITKTTPGRMQKAFKNLLGVSPKNFLTTKRMERFKENVKTNDVITSLYESGFGSSRSLYEKAGENLGMTPATYKKGGEGIAIKYAVSDSPLGKMLVAVTEKGVCSVSFGDSEEELFAELTREFFAANIVKSSRELERTIAAIIESFSGGTAILELPLDIRATAFQMRVWAELRKIRFGETRSYAEIAEKIGNKKSVRAVARACATNPVALVTPCHRVIASDGKLSGYRWGIERKARILMNEKLRRS